MVIEIMDSDHLQAAWGVVSVSRTDYRLWAKFSNWRSCISTVIFNKNNWRRGKRSDIYVTKETAEHRGLDIKLLLMWDKFCNRIEKNYLHVTEFWEKQRKSCCGLYFSPLTVAESCYFFHISQCQLVPFTTNQCTYL